MLLLKIAFRNIFRNKRRSIFTAITMIIGFVLTAATISIQDGSYDMMINSFTEITTGDLQIHYGDYLDSPSLYKTIDESLKIEEIVKKNIKIKAIYPSINGGGLAFTNGTPIPISIKGVSDEKIAKITSTMLSNTSLKKNEDSKDDIYEIIISEKISKNLNVKLGEILYIISQGADGSTANDQFKVVGIMKKDMTSRSYIKLKDAQEFFVLYGRVHQYTIVIKDYKDAKKVSNKVNTLLKVNNIKNISSKPWQEIEKEFYKAMKGDKAGSNFLFFIIMIIVAIGVLNTILMAILERKREFGVLKAIGTRGGFIFKMIILESLIISILSVIISSIIFGLLNIYLVNVGILMPEPVSVGGMMMSSLKGVYSFRTFITPTMIIIFSALIVSLYPAYKASKIKPIDALNSY